MTAQDLLSIAAESLLIGSIALYTALFLDGIMARTRTAPGQLSLFDVQPEPIAPPPATETPRFEIVILPFVRPNRKPEPQPQAIDLAGLSIRQLKAIASKCQLPKYNVEPKANLQARLLAEVEGDRLAEAVAETAAA